MSHTDYFLNNEDDHDFTNYYWFRNGLTNEEVERADSLGISGNLTDGLTGNKKDNLKNSKDLYKTRKSKIAWIYSNDKSAWLYNKFIYFTSVANKKMWDLTLVGMTEAIQYAQYDSNKSHYGYHLDLGKGRQVRRKISIVVQLSDPSEYEGGDLVFYTRSTEKILPKEKGTVFVFPSFFLHKVTPVTKGLRKSLVAWVSGPAWK
jgi:PKHD-type hydroxylase